MTEKLKALLHEQASAPDFAAVDLAAITASGDRRVRRRRGLTALAGGLAALVVAGGVVVATADGDDGPDAADAADAPAFPAQVTWVVGSILHTPDGEQDLGVDTVAYVRTSAGLVLADAAGAVWSYVDGRPTRIGTTDARRPQLVGDPNGTLAAWVDMSDGDPVPVAVDVAAGVPVRFPGRTVVGFEGFYRIDAVDDRTIYWREASGPVAADLDSGEVSEVGEQGFVVAAEAGVVVLSLDGGDPHDDGVVIRRDGVDLPLPEVSATQAYLSPDARYLSLEGDRLDVVDTETGRPVRFDLSARGFAAGYEWTGPHTLAVVTATGAKRPLELWTCTVSDGACSPVAELGPLSEVETSGLTLPTGDTTG